MLGKALSKVYSYQDKQPAVWVRGRIVRSDKALSHTQVVTKGELRSQGSTAVGHALVLCAAGMKKKAEAMVLRVSVVGDIGIEFGFQLEGAEVAHVLRGKLSDNAFRKQGFQILDYRMEQITKAVLRKVREVF